MQAWTQPLLDLLERQKALSKEDLDEVRGKLEQPGAPDVREILMAYRQLTTEELIDGMLVVHGSDDWMVPGYVLQEQIGHGAMGTVFRATKNADGSDVALKLLSDKFLADKVAVDRFERELALARKLKTRGVPWYGERGRCRGGNHYYVMQRVKGENLRQRMLRLRGPISEDQAWKVLYQMSMVLKHMSKHGIVHRDIKPDNILIDDEVIWLIDLGLAIEPDDEEMQLTDDNLVMGTPYYMSPEQARGSRKLTVASDIYSLGATMYHVATRRPPFAGENALEVMTHHDRTPVEPPKCVRPNLSEEFSDLIVSMLAKHPLDRPTPDRLCERINKDLQSINKMDRPQEKQRFEPLPVDTPKTPTKPARKKTQVSGNVIAAAAHPDSTRRTKSGGPSAVHWLAFAGITIGVAILAFLMFSQPSAPEPQDRTPTPQTQRPDPKQPRPAKKRPDKSPIKKPAPPKEPRWPSRFADLTPGPPMRLVLRLSRLKPGKGWRFRSAKDGLRLSDHHNARKLFIRSLPGALHLSQASGVSFRIRLTGVRQISATFVRRGEKLDDIPGLGLQIGSLFLEIGRVKGPRRFHRIAEVRDLRLSTRKQLELPVDYLDRAASTHRVTVVCKGNRVTMTVVAGGKTDVLTATIQPRPGVLGLYSTGENGRVELTELTVEAQNMRQSAD